MPPTLSILQRMRRTFSQLLRLRPSQPLHYIVVSHPYTSQQNPSNDFEVLSIDHNGRLHTTDHHFALGRCLSGQIIFSADGHLGLVTHDEGEFGTFTLNDDGSPATLSVPFSDDFRAHRIFMEADGSTAWAINNNYEAQGGGIYRLSLSNDGEIRNKGFVVAADCPSLILPLSADRKLVVAKRMLGSSPGEDVHLLSWDNTPTRITSLQVFGEGRTRNTCGTLTRDGRYALIGNNDGLSAPPGGVAVIEVNRSADTLIRRQVFADIQEPTSIVTSPYGKTALIVDRTGHRDGAILELHHDPQLPETPFEIRGLIQYSGSFPIAPNIATMVENGPLRGTAYIAEAFGIRQIKFTDDGQIVDKGITKLGEDYDAFIGSMALQP